MRIAITGSGGRVGRALADRLAEDHEVIELPRQVIDLADAAAVEGVSGLDFEVLLHPAAITSLEGCEDDSELARKVNFEAPAMMARSCRRRGKRMVHFSTDYVLGGDREGLHPEGEEVDPRSVYAKTKAEAEAAVLEEDGCVMRLSWVFGPERAAFPDQVVNRALAGEAISAVADKTSLPCFTKDLATWVGQLVEAGCPSEIFHACQGGEPTSWHGMATRVVAQLHRAGKIPEAVEVERQRLSEMAAFRAIRPRHTAMSTARLAALLGAPPRGWEEALAEHVDRLLISR